MIKFNDYNVHEEKLFFEKDVSSIIFNELDNLNYDLVSQERHGHYSHVFKSEDPNLPDDDETYAAQFNLAREREGSKLFNENFEKKVVPFLKSHFKELKYFLKPNIVKINKDCYFRAHNDSYAGDIGYTFFFTKTWKWDYGGILTFVNKSGALPIFPHNNLFLIRITKTKFMCKYFL